MFQKRKNELIERDYRLEIELGPGPISCGKAKLRHSHVRAELLMDLCTIVKASTAAKTSPLLHRLPVELVCKINFMALCPPRQTNEDLIERAATKRAARRSSVLATACNPCPQAG